MPIVSMTRRKSPVWSGWGSMSVCMWEGGRLGCRCVVFASRLVPILFGYLGFLAFQLKVFYLEDRQQHFLGKGRDCQALGEGMTCLNPLSSPSQELRVQFPSAQAQAMPRSIAGSHSTPRAGGAGNGSGQRRSQPQGGECAGIWDVLHAPVLLLP